MKKHGWGSDSINTVISNILRLGVLLSGILVIIGAILFFFQHPAEPFAYKTFIGEPDRLKNVSTIIQQAFQFRSRPVIQLGLLVLIATPVLRVVFSMIAFMKEKDFFYTAVSIVIILILFYSLFLSN